KLAHCYILEFCRKNNCSNPVEKSRGALGCVDSTNPVICWRNGESSHAGSVTVASPVSKAAWQRQPPKSISRKSQLRQGSGIHAVPRKRLKASDSLQIHLSGRDRTLSNRNSLISPAVGQGSTLPMGLTVKCLRPHPFMHGFGRLP